MLTFGHQKIKAEKEEDCTMMGVGISVPPCVDVIPRIQLLPPNNVGQQTHLTIGLYVPYYLLLKFVFGIWEYKFNQKGKVGKGFTFCPRPLYAFVIIKSIIASCYKL